MVVICVCFSPGRISYYCCVGLFVSDIRQGLKEKGVWPLEGHTEEVQWHVFSVAEDEWFGVLFNASQGSLCLFNSRVHQVDVVCLQ